MARSPRAWIWRSSERIAIDFPAPVAPVMRKCSHSVELNSGVIAPQFGAAKFASESARRDQREASQVLSLATVVGIAEKEIAENGESYGRRYRSPNAVRGEPLPERTAQIEAPVEVGVHAP